MKRRFLEIAFVVAVAVVGGINAYNAQKPVPLSDIGMANVEALADTEDKPKYSVYPCPDGPGTECNTASKDRPSCSTKTYCK